MTLVFDAATVDRVTAACHEYVRTRVEVIERRDPGGPTSHRRFGRVLAFRSPMPAFNYVAGLSDDEAGLLPELLDWFAKDNPSGQVMLAPGRPVALTGIALARAGFAQTDFHCTFAGPPDMEQAAPAAGLESRRVESAEDLALFSDAYHEAREITAFRVPMAPWLELPGWSLHLGLVDGAPAGVGILFQHEGVGYLADAAVTPAARGRGLHRLLLDARCAEARAGGCDLICSQAAYLSTSARNMQRKGLSVIYTQAVWTRI